MVYSVRLNVKLADWVVSPAKNYQTYPQLYPQAVDRGGWQGVGAGVRVRSAQPQVLNFDVE